MDMIALAGELTLDEGKRNKMYLDSRGIPTIGIGHNLRDVPISDRAVSQIFEDDMAAVLAQLDADIPWYGQLSDARQRVLANMAYNMGIHGLLQFVHMLTALRSGDYEAAAAAMEQSLWARQVPNRAARLAAQMRKG